MPEVLPIRLGIDHLNKRLRIILKGVGGQEAEAYFESDQIAEFITILSQIHHVLILSEAGIELKMPIDPTIAFQPQAGALALGAYEGVSRLAVGTDDLSGTVALQLLSPSGRLSGFRITPETARRLGQGLVDAAEKTTTPTTKH